MGVMLGSPPPLPAAASYPLIGLTLDRYWEHWLEGGLEVIL